MSGWLEQKAAVTMNFDDFINKFEREIDMERNYTVIWMNSWKCRPYGKCHFLLNGMARTTSFCVYASKCPVLTHTIHIIICVISLKYNGRSNRLTSPHVSLHSAQPNQPFAQNVMNAWKRIKNEVYTYDLILSERAILSEKHTHTQTDFPMWTFSNITTKIVAYFFISFFLSFQFGRTFNSAHK